MPFQFKPPPALGLYSKESSTASVLLNEKAFSLNAECCAASLSLQAGAACPVLSSVMLSADTVGWLLGAAGPLGL